MAWAQSNTFTITATTSTWHDFFVYVFDTFLPTITGFSTSAHPDTSTFRRKVSYTFANNSYDSNTLTCYYWVDWVNSSSPTNLTCYHDLDYSVTPGDTSTETSVTGYTASNIVGNSWIGTYRFWKTTTNSRAFLITHGVTPWMYFPGYENLRTWGNPTNWTGTYQTRQQTHPSALWGVSNAANYYGVPDTYGAASTGNFMPISVPGATMSPDDNFIVRDPMMVYTFSGTDPDDCTLPGMWSATPDFGIMRNPVTVSVNDDRMYVTGPSNNSINNGTLYFVNGTDYWLRDGIGNDYLGHPAFYFGTSEPDLSI